MSSLLFLVLVAAVTACDECSCCSATCATYCVPVLGKPVFDCGATAFPFGCICVDCVPNVANIVGIIIGILIAIIGGCVACCYCCCRRRETKQIIILPPGTPMADGNTKLLATATE